MLVKWNTLQPTNQSINQSINSGYVHTTADSFSWRHEKLSVTVWTARARVGTSRPHTSNMVRRAWPRGFGELNPSPHSWIFTFVSVGSSPRSYLFTSATGRIGVHTAPKYCAKSIRYVTLHVQDRRGAASLCHRNRAATPFLCVNGNPFQYDFNAGAKAIRYRVNIASPNFLLLASTLTYLTSFPAVSRRTRATLRLSTFSFV